MYSLKNISLLILLLGLVSCASMGRNFKFQGPQSLTIGKTHKNDLLTIYGSPWRKGHNDGYEQWTYGYYHYSLFGNDITKDLIMTFDKDGKLKSYNYNSSENKGAISPINRKVIN